MIGPLSYREDIDASVKGGCTAPGCDHAHDAEGLVLSPLCHRGGVDAVYKDGVVTLVCRICESVIVNLALGRRPRA